MSLTLLALAFTALLIAGYLLYGRWIAARLGLDDARITPAHSKADGVDFVPTKPFYLFAQHFSAIAAAGPIAGPILACQNFGWAPCLIWIGLGVVFIGAVHDFSSLVASLRHGGCSIAEIARERLGGPAGRATMAFIWIALIYVIVAFADITAASFARGTEELEAAGVRFNPGGAVAAASVMYLALSVLMGLVQRWFSARTSRRSPSEHRPGRRSAARHLAALRSWFGRYYPLKPSQSAQDPGGSSSAPLWLLTLVFVPATFGVAWLGTHTSDWFVFEARTWGLVILVYCALASVTPVWALLQPRGYLGGFVLYSALAVGAIGVLFGGYELQQPAFAEPDPARPAPALMPFLFVTIACGACSGFHGLVCSGTTSKQIDRESHSRLVGYGAMLAEAFVALIALVTVAICSSDELRGLKPGTIYGNGIGEFLTLVIGRDKLAFAVTFGAMAFSTFVFDTLDVATRLGRYLVQELLGLSGLRGAALGTLLTIAPAALFLWFGGEGSYLRFWTLFGASNQLLAALTLMSIAVWLRKEGRSAWFVLLPLVFVLFITVWALISIARKSFEGAQGVDVAFANGVTSLALLSLAAFLVLRAARELTRAGALSTR